MICTESAKVIGPEELKEIIEEQVNNPTVERLMFIEVKGDTEKIFPCYVEAWSYDDVKPGDEHKSVAFQMTITQYYGGQFSMARVLVRESDLGTNKRIWDKPPKKDLRDETPWVEKGVQ